MVENSAIWQMYYKGRGRCDYLKRSAEGSAQAEIVSGFYSKLKNALQDNKEVWKQFEDFESAEARYNEEICADHFAEGFKFGLLLGVEAGGGSGTPLC